MNALSIAKAPASWNSTAIRNPTVSDFKRGFIQATLATAAFHLAWTFPTLSSFTFIYAYCLIDLSGVHSARAAFRFGLLGGLLVFAPHLAWFWKIFGAVSICLWSVIAFFTGAFVLSLHAWRARFDGKFLWIAAPVLWTGLEFFRSELYYLKFSWLSVGYAFGDTSSILPIGALGVYGTGFAVFFAAALTGMAARKRPWMLGAGVFTFTLLANLPVPKAATQAAPSVQVAGIQLEFPPSLAVPTFLDQVIQKHPAAEILVLSEYTFDSQVPAQVRDWCRENRRYLIAGGKDDRVGGNFYNTAFVIGPTGETVFSQAKSVPIQFFKDGIPAPTQEIWRSPWGRIAIPTCYDLGYRRVTDEFIKKGAQAFIVPFMDVTEWGAQQHTLHTRIAPIRAREYGVPIFRLGSSGISQHIDAEGNVLATGEFPGQEQIIAGTLSLAQTARLPLDNWLAPAASALTAAFVLSLCIRPFVRKRGRVYIEPSPH